MADSLRAQQFAFAAHLRDPQANPPPPGIEDRRMAVYRELFLNNIEGLLAGNFPVIRQTLGDNAWRALVREFHAHHRSRTPLFAEIGREFIRFLQVRHDNDGNDPPWLAELAHYEWVELALHLADVPVSGFNADGDLALGIPLLSPLAWPLAYRWPVQRIGPDWQPGEAPQAPTLLLVRRDDEGEVRFAQVSALVFRLLEILGSGEQTGEQALQQLAGEAGSDDPAGFMAQGLNMLAQLREDGTLLGTRRP